MATQNTAAADEARQATCIFQTFESLGGGGKAQLGGHWYAPRDAERFWAKFGLGGDENFKDSNGEQSSYLAVT